MASLHDGNPVVVVATGHRRVDQHLDVAVGAAGCSKVRTLCPLGLVTPQQVSTEVVVLLDEEDRSTVVGSCQSRTHAGRATTRYKDVRVDVPLVVGTMRAGFPVNSATWCKLL